MKRLGILGGMSWESTALYYQAINQGVKKELGGLHSADLVVRSVDFHQIEIWQSQNEWAKAERYLADCAVELKAAGAEGLVIATNTMHKLAEGIVAASGLELLHIADCTAREVQRRKYQTVALLGTAFTMEQPFYKDRLISRFGINVIVPNETERAAIHDVIYQELCKGVVRESSRDRYVEIADQMAHRGAEAVILGCTEIGMLLNQTVTEVPLIDTTLVHAKEAVAWMTHV